MKVGTLKMECGDDEKFFLSQENHYLESRFLRKQTFLNKNTRRR